EFRKVAETLSYEQPRIPIAATARGDVATPEYWVRQVRETVRFMDGVRWLDQQGVTRFLELGPDGVLSALVGDAFAVPAMRRRRPEAEALMTFLAEAYASGVVLEWPLGGRRVPLPKYAFQRKRYWLEAGAPARRLQAGGHPLIDSVVPVAGEDEWIFTGTLSLRTEPWIAGHDVFG